MNRKRTVIGCVIAVGILATLGILSVVALKPIAGAVLSAFLGMGHIRESESAMRDPKVYTPVAETLALYCQSAPSLFPEYMNDAWLPEELNAIGHGRASVSTNYAHVEMGGGFHHFGYHLALDQDASTTGTNVWQLYMYSEGSEDQRLRTFPVDSTRRFLPDQLLSRVVAGLDKQILRKPDDASAHQSKIQTYLRFDRVDQAREACRSMLQSMPDAWWPVLVNALILTEEESRDQAEETLSVWVQKDENFFRYMDLAYFFQLTGKPDKAADAMRQSTGYTGNTPWGHGGNAEHRGYTAAMFAYQSGEYDAVVQLCDHLLKITVNGDYAKAGLRELREAAVTAKKKPAHAPSLTWAEGIGPFDPFEDVDIEKLLQRPVPRMTNKQYWKQRQCVRTPR